MNPETSRTFEASIIKGSRPAISFQLDFELRVRESTWSPLSMNGVLSASALVTCEQCLDENVIRTSVSQRG